ncbi:hypothetical protein [Legionella fairfieldensis]|uniref:hypothetical protein n=1 Tax=Legionella fairfieldensis TaxID=45064 RepID=UPI00048D3C3F|nr:hypothetical protein [Legionella fairfieldensis]
MNSNEYFNQQETRKKIFELTSEEAARKKILNEMINAEIEFVNKNLYKKPNKPIKASVDNREIEFSLKQPVNNKKQDIIANEIHFEKLTPHNFFEKVKITDVSNDGEEADLSAILRNKPELMQKICDALNEMTLDKIQKSLGDSENLIKIDDGQRLGYRKIAPVADSAQEVSDILERAKNYKNSMEATHSNEEEKTLPDNFQPRI